MRTDESVLGLLGEAPLSVVGLLAEASNHTLLVKVGEPADSEQAGTVHAIYKPRVGERPLWDFPPGTLCRRETAAYAVSEFLGWKIVPPTLLRDGPMGVGSLQLFIPHDPSRHYFVLVEDARHHPTLARMAVFDLLVNNADRKASHVILGEDGHIWGVDHGVTFHAQPKLRTVIWELGGTALQAAWCQDLRRLVAALARPTDALTRRLQDLLSAQEIAALGRRAAALAAARGLPDVHERRRPYPWPLL